MPVPKKKVSKSRKKMRRAEDRMTVPDHIRKCPQCGEPVLQHRVCTACGFYRGKEVIEIPLD
ncbi:MAG: 50S ribosomal protein L32 [Pseudomonadota bacterium]